MFSGLLLLTLDFDIKHIHLTANTPTPPVLNTQIRTNLEANVSDLPVLNSQVRRANRTLSAMAKRVSRISAARCVNADYRMTPYQVSLKFSYPNDCRIVVNWGDLEFTKKWCDMHTCFDYSLPGCSEFFTQANPVLKVYAYPPSNPYSAGDIQFHWETLLRSQQRFDDWQLVDSPQEACVFVVTGFPNDILNVSHFNATAHGANHLLLGATAAGFHPAVHQDYPGAPFDSGDAMMATFNSVPSSHRRGFDVQLTPFKAAWMEDDGSDPYQRLRSAIALNESLPKMRSLERSVDLLFKANIFHWPKWSFNRWVRRLRHRDAWRHPVGWHARNLFLKLLATEWRSSELVILADVICNEQFEYQIPREEYTLWMMKSKFVFCPGGGGEFSWRFTETLAAGAVPVVLRSNLLPTGVDWDDCVVTINLKSMRSLPSLLETRYLQEWNERSERCLVIFRTHFATLDAQLNFTLSQVRDNVIAGAVSVDKERALPLPCMRDFRK